jgi:anti-sigma factor RsiW
VNDQQTSVEEEDIHAYVDETLSDHRRLHVEQALERNPVLVARVSDYFSLNSMVHERYKHVLNEPVQTRQQPRTLRRWREATNRPHFAGLAAALAIGVGIGVGANMGKNAIAQLLSGTVNTRSVSYETPDAFAREAAIAHVVYMPSGYRPADMDADQEQEFVQLLANRLGTTVRPPILTKSGFELTDGCILPGDDGPVAQFMYRESKDERVTPCISHRKANTNTTAFKLYQDGSVNVFYRVDGNFGYAVSGGIDRSVLLQLSHDVYAQLTAAPRG